MCSTKVIFLLFTTLWVGEALDPWVIIRKAQVTSTTCPNSLTVTMMCQNETTAQICFNGNAVGTISCKEPTPTCSGGACVENSICAMDGIYPDPAKCNAYYYCYDNDQAMRIDCSTMSPSAVYDPELKSCSSNRKTCYIMNSLCRNKKMVGYPGDRSIFALCENNKVRQMFSCPEGMTFDDFYQTCDYQCTQNGKMANPDLCSQYFECIKTGTNKFIKFPVNCPPDFIYDPTLKLCKPGSCPPI